MKHILAFLVLSLAPSLAFAAADKCSIGLANKFAKAIIEVSVEENNYTAGKLVFQRSNSHEYTSEDLAERARLSGRPYAEQYLAMKKEVDANPSLHIYSLQYKWDAENKLDLGFYYTVRLTAYDRGCSLESISSK